MARPKKIKEEVVESVEMLPIINKEETHSEKEEKPVNRAVYVGSSIVEALKSVGVDSSYASRQEIWKKNNLKSIQGMDYLGLGQQNKIMVNLFKEGKLTL